jgi:dihydroflavonol-4-reductase
MDRSFPVSVSVHERAEYGLTVRHDCHKMTNLIMKALVTGGTGFIGSHLVEHLSTQNAEVYALVRDRRRLRFLDKRAAKLIEGDLFNVPALPSDLNCVFHCAGLTKTHKSADYYTVNHRGTASFFTAIEQQGHRPRLVYLSSFSACGPSLGNRPRCESDSPAPVTSYGKSKLLGEQETLRRKRVFQTTVVRVGAVYGPRDRDFLNLFRLVRFGVLPTVGLKERRLTICYIKDLVRALALVAQSDFESGEIFNIGDPIPATMEGIGRAAGRAIGRRPKPIPIPLPLAFAVVTTFELVRFLSKQPNIINRDKYREYCQPGWVADVSKAREKLMFTTRYSLDEGIRETGDWYRANGWL